MDDVRRIAEALERIATALETPRRKRKRAPVEESGEIEISELDRAAVRAAARRVGWAVRGDRK